MQKLRIDQDIKPLSEVRNGMATYIKQIHETKRPLIITQRGKSAAVLIDVKEFEAMQEKIAILSDIHSSLNQLEKGEGINHKDAKNMLLERISR
jgi:prevent-host-death family protein